LDQRNSPPEKVVATLIALAGDAAVRSKIQSALAQWHAPKAAEVIAENILKAVGQDVGNFARGGSTPSMGGEIKLKMVT
ncbi:MAG: hypothetical protein JF609_10325, partial [Verrucomicrobia bacterium]|nr:hypothetical protein [Verrucomicrobiota bacterium]